MTFWDWLSENLTKVLGWSTTFFGTLGTMIQAGAFNEVLSRPTVIWMGILSAMATAMLGGATTARGFNNTSKERIAQAMVTAIKATPGEDLPPVVTNLVKPEDMK